MTCRYLRISSQSTLFDDIFVKTTKKDLQIELLQSIPVKDDNYCEHFRIKGDSQNWEWNSSSQRSSGASKLWMWRNSEVRQMHAQTESHDVWNVDVLRY